METELEALFLEAHKLYLSVNESQLERNSKEYQLRVQHALQLSNDVAELIANEHIFSPNEELDDIKTDSIKLLLTPYYQAELQLQVVDKERLDHLTSAKIYFAHFLRQGEKLSLVHKDDLATLYSDARLEPTARRAVLVGRAQREKEAKAKLMALQKEMALRSDVDEELQRSCWIAMLHSAIPNAIRQLEMTETEMKMLESVANMEPPRITLDSRGNRVVPPPTQNNNKPIAYTILPGGRRVDLKAQVFQPGFNMATVTPEQAYEAEVKAGRMVTGGGKASEKKSDSDDEDDDIDDDAKLYKARAWDDFKDDHPFGSGNTKR